MSASVMPGALERLGHGERRADEELIGRIDADVRPAAERGERLVAERARLLLAHEQDGRGAVGERRGVAGGERAVLREDRLSLASFSTLVSARTRPSSCNRLAARRRHAA